MYAIAIKKDGVWELWQKDDKVELYSEIDIEPVCEINIKEYGGSNVKIFKLIDIDLDIRVNIKK